MTNVWRRVEVRKEREAKGKARLEAEAKRESMARQNRYIGVLDKFIHEGHEALSSFAKTDRVNFNEKESKEYIAASQHIFAVSHKEALCIKTNIAVRGRVEFPSQRLLLTRWRDFRLTS